METPTLERFRRMLRRGWTVEHYRSDYTDRMRVALRAPSGAYPPGGDFDSESGAAQRIRLALLAERAQRTGRVSLHWSKDS